MIFLPETALSHNIFCFTTSVHGGVSDGNYKSFNVGMHVNDNEHRVATNRELLQAIISQQALNRKTSNIQPKIALVKWLNQQHGNTVCDYNDVRADHTDGNETRACDAIYTKLINTPLAIMSADCLPIVIACGNSGQIAAIHAGWRGLTSGILRNTLNTFKDKSSLRVWIGPSISQAHFHVGDDIIAKFDEYSRAVLRLESANKYAIDLAKIAQIQLAELGVDELEKSTVCSYSDERCFSHRKVNHTGLSNTGRMATIIMRI